MDKQIAELKDISRWIERSIDIIEDNTETALMRLRHDAEDLLRIVRDMESGRAD